MTKEELEILLNYVPNHVSIVDIRIGFMQLECHIQLNDGRTLKFARLADKDSEWLFVGVESLI